MPRILINECIQEVSSFNPIPSSIEQFQCRFADQAIAAHGDLESEVSGALQIFTDAGYECIAGFSARAMSSGGKLNDTDFDYISTQILDSVRKHHKDVDGFYFALHGAMQTSSCDDPEGWLLEQVEDIIGRDMPVVISLDLHGILTEKMCRHSWGLSMLHTYPHVDFSENGQRAAALLIHFIQTQKRAQYIDIPIPALVRGDELITDTGILGKLYACTNDMVNNQDAVLSAGLMIGNPFTDVPELGSHVLALCDDKNKIDAITEQCRSIAQRFWDHRESMQAEVCALEKALSLHAQHGGPSIFADAADATSSGASGDSNAILHGLIKHDIQAACLLPILDEKAALQAHKAGVGAEISLSLGGSCDPQFTPLKLIVTVTALSNGIIPNESHGGSYDAGCCAVVQHKNICIIIFSKPIHLFDRSLFLGHTINPQDFDIVVVKSPHTQHDFFSAWSQATYIIDVPGATSAQLNRLGHQKCQRPIFPLDDISEFNADARIYS